MSPPLALVAGLAYGFTFEHPYHLDARKLSRLLLQVSVVGLGFGMNLQQVLRVGRSGLIYTAAGITFAMLLGWGLGKLLAVKSRVSFLISAGTAICGGSAIAAVAPVTNATDEEIAVSLGTVFALNSVALLAFPAIGAALHLTQTQFGLWSALAIHDTSSVVGAAAKYGVVALAVGTTVKLARALWIVPMSVGTALVEKKKTKIQWPWFILFFCLASVANTYVPVFQTAYPVLRHLGNSWADGHAVSDRHRNLDAHFARSGSPAAAARNHVVGGGCDGLACSDSRGLDSSLIRQIGKVKCPAFESAGHFYSRFGADQR